MPEGDTIDLKVKLVSTLVGAPGPVTVTGPAVAGSGTNAASWNGAAFVADAALETEGALSITGGAGTNSITLSVDNGFIFDENDAASYTFEVVGVHSPIYVDAVNGDDITGAGTEASPLKSITMALNWARALPAAEIHAAPGLYDAANGEAFPYAVPAGCPIIGTMGTAQDETDSTLIDAGGAAKAFAMAVTPSGTTGLLQDLVITNFLLACDVTGWRGTIDNCVFTNCATGATDTMLFYHASGAMDFQLTNSLMKDLQNAGAKHLWHFVAGSGPIVVDDCLFQNIKGGAPNDRRGFFNIEFGSYDFRLTITDTTFDTIVYTAQNHVEAGMIEPFGYHGSSTGFFLMDRCIVRNISLNTPIINPNRVKGTPTVRNCLFYNVNAGSHGAVTSFYCPVEGRNNTFDLCSAATNGNWGTSSIKFYNSSISNCAKANNDGTKKPLFCNVNVFNSPEGGGWDPASVAVTDYDPKYKNVDTADYRLKAASQLVDAGNDTYVNWADPTDLLGNVRQIDGDGEGTAQVDIGAYEFDPAVMDPTFVTPQTSYKVYAGTTLTVPVSVNPAVAGAVTGAVSYGDDLSGPATIDLPTGAGPVGLVVNVAATLVQPSGSPSIVGIVETSARGVQPGEFTVYPYTRAVKLTTATKVYLAESDVLEIGVALADAGLAAPGAITVTTGTPAGWGTNAFAWSGGTTIPAGDSQSEGVLSITGGIGVNTIDLTADNGFVFSESGASSVTITVVGFASPLYVATTGSDETGTGSQANPFRSITYALNCAAVNAATEINVAAGTYDVTGGEEFPLIVPGDCSIMGVAGPERTGDDSTVINADGIAAMMTVSATPSGGTPGLLQDLALVGALGTTIRATGWTATIDNCVISGVANAPATASGIEASASKLTITGTTVEDINTSALHVINVIGSGSMLTMNACTLQNLRCAGEASRGKGIIYTDNTAVKITDSTFDNIAQTNAQVEGGVLTFWYSTFLMDRCVVSNVTTGSAVVTTNRTASAVIRDTLFTTIQTGDWGAMSCFYAAIDVRNCTFNGCSSATSTNWGQTGYAGTRFYNTIVSNCSKLNSDVPDNLRLFKVDIWNVTDAARYDAAGSVDVTELDPQYADAANGDFHLQPASALVDAGDNAYVNWGSEADPATDLDGLLRIEDGNADENAVVDLGCYEAQPPGGATVAEFTVTDRTTGSTLFTNEATVNVAVTLDVPEGVTVAGVQVTESDAEPVDGWLAEAPATYAIQASPGASVTLYAWVKDTTGNVNSKPAAILYDTRVPVVSNVAVTDNGGGAATATWTTDIPAEGAVMYGPVAMAGTTPNTVPENAVGISHSVVLTGIAPATNYKIILVNNEIASAPVYWPRPWPIEGDANMDCRVNILDLIFIRNKLNLDVASGDNWKADVNEDARINILDLIYVRNKLNTQCP